MTFVNCVAFYLIFTNLLPLTRGWMFVVTSGCEVVLQGSENSVLRSENPVLGLEKF